MLTLLCCAELHGEKVNLEVTWDELPGSLADLQYGISDVFTQEVAACRPLAGGPSAPSFDIARVQVYDDDLLCWADLASLSQLHGFDQLYVFQPQTRWHQDTQQDLPPPRPPTRSRASLAFARGAIGVVPASYSGDASGATHWGGAAAAQSRQYSASGAPSRGWSLTHTSALLEQRRREEETVVEKLVRLRRERDELERQAAVEEEMERRQRAAEADARLHESEGEIWRQRSALRRAEEEFQRLLREKQRLVGREMD